MKISNNSKRTHIDNVAEILGILDEKSLSKDWILEVIKRYKIKTKASVSSNTYEILKNCSPEKVKKILTILRDKNSAIKDVKALTKTLHWFFIDIISSSDPNLSVKSQARKINALNVLIQRTNTFKEESLESLSIMPTGDGMAIGFPDSPEKPFRLAIELHKALKKFNMSQKEKDRVNVRIGIDTGPVYFMKGIKGGEIFWGPGLIRAKRVMDLCGPNQIFASDVIAKDLRSLSQENKATMHPIEDKYEVKHGEQLTIYNFFSKDFGNKTIPKTGKILKVKEELLRKEPDFEFESVEIRLDIKDVESMMTHHTWIWNLKNISKEPLGVMYYKIGGDVPKKFSDLNIRITDEKNNNLGVLSNETKKRKDFEKVFHVKLQTPIKKSQKGRFLKLEYDWEEPDRIFEYMLVAKCKKFKYVLSASKELEIKNKVLQKDYQGKKIRVEITPKTKYLKNRTEIIWETPKNHKIHFLDSFEFCW